MNTLKRIFLNERFIFIIIIFNAIIIFAQEMGLSQWWINALDALCTLIFLVEMIMKQRTYGIKEYWSQGWNVFDGSLVILSLPSIIYYFWPNIAFNISFLLALRLLRVFRFFRVFHLFPNIKQTVNNIQLAIRQSFSIFIGFGILLFVFSLISCAFFHSASPEYFGDPIESLYSTFRMCTIEGWYEIPEAVAQGAPLWSEHLIRVYFIGILVIMGIIGMSIVNSIFVDAMVSDNNDEVLKEIKELKKEIQELKKS